MAASFDRNERFQKSSDMFAKHAALLSAADAAQEGSPGRKSWVTGAQNPLSFLSCLAPEGA
jgi:hypothetical protein